jgi:hypothetical protein
MNDLFKPIGNLAAYSDREILEDIHRMLVELTKAKAAPKVKGAPKARHEYSEEFESFWNAYPARNGSNNKWKASQCWNARKREGVSISTMMAGLGRYRAWCEATGKIGTDFVMQATRFLGPAREFEQPWDLPAPEVKVVKIPPNGDDLVKFAKGYGVTTAAGESWFDFRRRVETAVEAAQ